MSGWFFLEGEEGEKGTIVRKNPIGTSVSNARVRTRGRAALDRGAPVGSRSRADKSVSDGVLTGLARGCARAGGFERARGTGAGAKGAPRGSGAPPLAATGTARARGADARATRRADPVPPRVSAGPSLPRGRRGGGRATMRGTRGSDIFSPRLRLGSARAPGSRASGVFERARAFAPSRTLQKGLDMWFMALSVYTTEYSSSPPAASRGSGLL